MDMCFEFARDWPLIKLSITDITAMQMIAHPGWFPLPEKKADLAAYLTRTINPFVTSAFQPYHPSDNDTDTYVLDTANDWRLVLCGGQNIDLRYRYQSKDRQPQEEVLAAWLLARDIAYPTQSFHLCIEPAPDRKALRPPDWATLRADYSATPAPPAPTG